MIVFVLVFPAFLGIVQIQNTTLEHKNVEFFTGTSLVPLLNVGSVESDGYLLATAFWHTCHGSNKTASLICWGKNSAGQHGIGTTGSINTPISSLGLNSPVIDLDVGTSDSTHGYTCAVTQMNELYCWGSNNKKQLGLGDNTPTSTPSKVYFGSNLGAVKVSTGYEHACAVLTDGNISCWGWGNDGRLGDGGNADRGLPTPTSSLGANRTAVDISTSWQHSCALLDDGSVVCWGDGGYGKLGTGNTNMRTTPHQVIGFGPSKPVKQITSGYYHTCALLVNGSVSCWGSNAYGELGRVQINGINPHPGLVSGLFGKNIVFIEAGYYSTCAIDDLGEMYCWGNNEWGQLGDGSLSSTTQPVKSTSLGFNRRAVAVSMDWHHTCVLLDDASVNCWGDNEYGQLGDGAFESAFTPRVYGNRTLASPTVSNLIEMQNASILLDGEIFDSLDTNTLNVSIDIPSGMTFNSTSMVLRGYPVYSTQSVWNLTISDVNQSQSGHYRLTILSDTDRDTIPNMEDLDDDNDGVPDELDACPTQVGNSSLDVVGCVDSDGDGVSNNGDAFPNDVTQQTDSDQDGYGDNASGTLPDGCPSDYGLSLRGELFGCLDGDGDGWADSIDAYPAEISQWNDSDGDGFGDSLIGLRGDACPTEFGPSHEDRFGCPDNDSDGWSNDGDAFPDDATQHADQDTDGYGDNQSSGATLVDTFPTDATQWVDADGDGYGDNPTGNQGDVFPNDPNEWLDTDGDTVGNNADAFPFDPSQTTDTDGDGFGDNQRGNGADKFPTDATQWSDIDGDGYGDNPEGTTPDAFIADPTQWLDADGDGYGDNPTGRQADAFPNDATQWLDQDGDGLGDNQSGTDPDPYLFDFDNDGYNDSIDPLPKLSSPGDLDNDGVRDEIDLFPEDYREWADADGDGEGDNADTDDDNDGWPDADEIRQGTDPLSGTSQPVDSFEMVIPGTAIGLGAWDLIGMFGGIPLAFWVLFGFVTRNQRTAKYETMLRRSNSRDELEEVARQWEYSLMLRLLGPHQGIRLERLRAELDDRFEAMNQPLSSLDEAHVDQTHLVQSELEDDWKELPALNNNDLEENINGHPGIDTPAQDTDESGYEWFTNEDGVSFYRLSGSYEAWTRYDG